MEGRNGSPVLNTASRRAPGKPAREEGPFVGPDVVEALKEGDHNAFDRVFRAYYNRVKGFVNSLVKCGEDAEDIVSDVFASLWVNRHRLDPALNFNSFLYTSAKNAVLNYFRRNKVRTAYAGNAPKEQDAPLSDEEFIARETELMIKLAVGRMPLQRQTVFVLSKEDGLSNDEIAQQLGISKKTVEKHMRLALADIRRVISALLFLLRF